LAVAGQCITEMTVGGGKVRVDVERPLEFRHSILGASQQEGRPAQREMRPWVVIV
jgi:hypothetical protein